jgi:hypothetical protein
MRRQSQNTEQPCIVKRCTCSVFPRMAGDEETIRPELRDEAFDHAGTRRSEQATHYGTHPDWLHWFSTNPVQDFIFSILSNSYLRPRAFCFTLIHGVRVGCDNESCPARSWFGGSGGRSPRPPRKNHGVNRNMIDDHHPPTDRNSQGPRRSQTPPPHATETTVIQSEKTTPP